MKKVLFITNLPSPYRVAFFDELGKCADVTVVYADLPEDHQGREAAWFEKAKGNFREVWLKKRWKLFREANLCLDVIDFIKQPFDEIILCGYSSPTFLLAIAYMKAKKIPFCLEADGGLVREESGLKYKFKRSLVSSASTWLSSGKCTTDFFCHYGADREKVYTYPFTSLSQGDMLDEVPSQGEKQTLRRELGIPEPKMVLSIGQFIPRKGFDILMEAASKLEEDVGIYIVGGEPTEEYLRMQNDLDLSQVHFVGFQKKDVLSKYYRAADVFVLPTREDIWGLVINEAMSYGLSVVTTNRCVAGLELVENGVSGYIVPVEDADALAERTAAILDGDSCRMGQAALDAIRPYTLENMAKAHLDFLNR